MNPELIFTIFAFISGLFIGSFINVIIERTHRDEAWWNGRSKCENCNKNLTALELIPIFSFLFQKGKCKNCSTKLSLQYPLVELISGLICGFVVYKYGFGLQGLILSLIGILLLGNFISDLKYMELPEAFSIPTILLAVIYQIIFPTTSVKNILIGAVFGFLFFVLQYILTRGKGIGSGDIRLGLIMGILLSWPLALVGIMISYIGGSIISLTLLVFKKINMKSAVPLGVFLIPGLIGVFIFSEIFLSIIESYSLIFQ